MNNFLTRSIKYSFTTKIISFVSGPVNAFLISNFFTEQVQGFYYTFFSILTIQVFIELGLGTVTQHFASHEWINLNIKKGKIFGNYDSLNRLSEICKFSLKWFLIGAILFTIFVLLFGFIFFNNSDNSSNVNWQLPWTFLCLIAGLNIVLTPLISVLEGCNRVNQVYLYRLILALCIFFSSVLSIILNFQLWTAVTIVFSNFLCTIIFLFFFYKDFFIQLLLIKNSNNFDWKNEMLPMQWKIAASWVSGYLTFNLYTPLVFYYLGSELAGKFGMTWSILAALMSISTSFLYPKIPEMSMLVAKNKLNDLGIYFSNLFKGVLLSTLVISTIIYLLLFHVIENLNIYFLNNFVDRILDEKYFIIVLIGQIFFIIGNSFSAYMRSFKKEPVMNVHIIVGISSLILVFISVKYFNIYAVTLVYLFLHLISLPIIFKIYQNFKTKRLQEYEKK